ncbi:MAG TPA: CBS domain-containing protein, partial [Methylomirabilota bacterium]|nr:CBS domain-containing protein [Methylomirabilota bacterium]
IARTAREPASPAVERRIALVGPLTSLGLAALFGGVRALAAGVPALAVPALWLAHVNLAVGLFNLLPGFPLDGGRVLRALVWQRTGDFARATRVAAFSGQALAAVLIALGVIAMLRGNALGGAWTVVIAWFLQNAATATTGEAAVRALLAGVRVAQVMTRDCPRVPGDRTLERLVHEEVLGAGRRCFLVTDDGRLRGLLTLHELKAVPRQRWREVRAEEVMAPTDKLAAVEPGDDLLRALERMDDADVAQLPVMTAGELVGLVGREQILHYVRTRSELGV